MQVVGYYSLNETHMNANEDISTITATDVSQYSLSLTTRAMVAMIYLVLLYMVKEFYFARKKKKDVRILAAHLLIMVIYCLISVINSISKIVPCLEYFYIGSLFKSIAHFLKNMLFFEKSQKMYTLIRSKGIKNILNIVGWIVCLAIFVIDFLSVYFGGVQKDKFLSCVQYATNLVDTLAPVLNAFAEMYFVAVFLLPVVLQKDSTLASFLYQVRNDGILYLLLSVIVSIIIVIARSTSFDPATDEVLKLLLFVIVSVCLVFDIVYHKSSRGAVREMEPLQRSQKWNMALIGILAVLTIASQLIIQLLLKDQLGSLTRINIAGRQRMLSKRITVEIQELFRNYTGNPLVDLKARSAGLNASVALFSKSHYGLMNGDVDLAIGSEGSDYIMGKFNAIQPLFDQIVATAKNTSGRMLYDPGNVNQTYISELMYSFRVPFLAKMNEITVLITEYSVSKVNKTQMWEWIILGGSILVSLIISIIVIVPALKSRKGLKPKDSSRLTLNAMFIVLMSCCMALIKVSFTKQAEDANRINIAGRQRMLSQLLVAQVYDIQRFETYSIDNNEKRYIKALNTSLNLWTTSQSALINGNKAFAMNAEQDLRMLALFRDIQGNQNSMVDAVSAITKRFPSTPPTNEELSLLETNRKVFLTKMNTITGKYEEYSRKDLTFLVFLVAVLAIFMVIALTLMVIFSFLTMIKTSEDNSSFKSSNFASGKYSESNESHSKEESKPGLSNNSNQTKKSVTILKSSTNASDSKQMKMAVISESSDVNAIKQAEPQTNKVPSSDSN